MSITPCRATAYRRHLSCLFAALSAALFVPLFAGSAARADDIVIEAPLHHLGDNAGNEGTTFSKTFTVPDGYGRARLHIEFPVGLIGPNLERAPRVFINGTYVAGLPGWFGPYDAAKPNWQTNADGSHDYNGGFNARFDVTELLKPGVNTFRIENGRPEDDYFFRNLVIKQVTGGRIFHVRTGGSDAADGLTWATAKKTIQPALDAATGEDDQVWVKRGLYVINQSLLVAGGRQLYGGFVGDEQFLYQRPLLRESEDATRTRIRGGNFDGTGMVVQTGAPQRIDSVTVENCIENIAAFDSSAVFYLVIAWYNRPGTIAFPYPHGMTLINFNGRVQYGSITNNHNDIGGAGLLLYGGGYALLDGNRIYDNTTTGYGGGINAGGLGKLELRGNFIFRNTASHNGGGAEVTCPALVHNNWFDSNVAQYNTALTLAYTTDNQVINNTFLNNRHVNGGSALGLYQATALIANNIFLNNPAGAVGINKGGANVPDVSLGYNCFFGNAFDVYAPVIDLGGNLFNTDPLSLNGSSLRKDSPCINAGKDSFVVDPAGGDFNGNPRIQNGRVDIGAAEKPTPILFSLSPASALVGGGQVTVTVNGSRFESDAAVLFNGAVRPTTYLSAMQLTVQLSAADAASLGTFPIAVSHAGAGTSAALPFVVGRPALRITAATASRSGANVIMTVTLTNSGGHTAQGIFLTRARLNNLNAVTLPAVADIAAGGTGVVSLTFPNVPQGARPLTLQANYNGGLFAASRAVLVP